ncbi:Putative E3 ubiquitin-protein ligase TRIML1 [Myotis brandtii]|uniref:Putative E3 ubiquitin-protein ligase TRIML1 n=1 Tax=Myotis brandtii TaxID=109478 RepID=S7QDM7_MYOBR|nr:Putative E3 ubiquitin-protein ligase TRIML1 [Myotis brandtii]
MENLREELTCFICLDYFTSPVTTECGHSFCLVCLLRSWEQHNTPFSCPECWRTLEAPHFQPNERLGRLAGIGKQLRSQVLQSEDQQGPYGRMLAATMMYPGDDQGVNAFSSQCHGINRMSLSSEAEEHHKVVVSEYVKMHQFLKEEEQLHLQLLEKEERENLKKLRDNEIKLIQQVRGLSKMIGQIESMCQNSSIASLEEMEEALERSEPLLLQCPETTSTELSLCRITGMREMLRKFHADITLDPDTANAYLILSEDLKSVRYGGIRQKLPDNPERFDQSATVLGAQSFTCGRHYWEVEVGNKTEWEVGICKDSVSRKGNLPKPPGDLFSLIGLKIGDDYSLWVSSPLKGQHVREPVQKVGVFLDYESGHIAFYNVTDESLIYSFPPDSFEEALRPIFSPCLPNEGTNTGPLTICSLNSYV